MALGRWACVRRRALAPRAPATAESERGGSGTLAGVTALDVRPFRPTDEDDVVELWRRCGLVRPWNDRRRDVARKLDAQPDLFFVAVAHGEIVGSVMAGYDGHRGWINYLAVAPEARAGGIGRALMGHAERALGALGCPKVNLQVRAQNESALAFYQRLGYVQDDVVSLGKRLVHDDAG